MYPISPHGPIPPGGGTLQQNMWPTPQKGSTSLSYLGYNFFFTYTPNTIAKLFILRFSYSRKIAFIGVCTIVALSQNLTWHTYFEKWLIMRLLTFIWFGVETNFHLLHVIPLICVSIDLALSPIIPYTCIVSIIALYFAAHICCKLFFCLVLLAADGWWCVHASRFV